MEMKHTPGPWGVVRINERGYQTPDGDSWWVYAGDGNGWVGESYMSACIGSENGAEANARLIAAAPDLLDALRQLVGNADLADHVVRQHDEDGYLASALFDTIRQAEAVIAKAIQP